MFILSKRRREEREKKKREAKKEKNTPKTKKPTKNPNKREKKTKKRIMRMGERYVYCVLPGKIECLQFSRQVFVHMSFKMFQRISGFDNIWD